MLLRARAWAVASVLTVAAGVTVLSCMFALATQLWTGPFAGLQTTGVFSVGRVDRWQREISISLAEFRAAERNTTGGAAIAGSSRAEAIVKMPGRAEPVGVSIVSGRYADVFRIQPALGRFIGASDDYQGASVVAVISDRLFKTWFDGDQRALGRPVVLRSINDRRTATTAQGEIEASVVGVAPAELNAAYPAVDVWVSVSSWQRLTPRLYWPSTFYLRVANVTAVPPFVEAQLRESLGVDARAGSTDTLEVAPVPADLRSSVDRAMSATAWWGAALLALSMLLTHAMLVSVWTIGRRRGVATRVAMGASVFQATGAAAGLPVLTALLGGAIAWVATGYVIGALNAALPSAGVAWVRTGVGVNHIELATLAIVVVACSYVTAVSGIWNTAVTGRAQRGRRRSRALAGVVVLQVAVVVVVFIATGFFIANSPAAVRHRERVNMRVDDVLAATMNLSWHNYNEASGGQFVNSLLQRARSTRGVEAAVAGALPGSDAVPWRATIGVPGGPASQTGVRRVTASIVSVSSDFLKVVGLRLVSGRDFSEQDRQGTTAVAIVSRSMAATLWPADDAVGKVAMLGAQGPLTVIGVAEDPVTDLDEEHSPLDSASNVVLVPYRQRYAPTAILLTHSSGDRISADDQAALIRAMAPDVAVKSGPAKEILFVHDRAAAIMAGVIDACAAAAALIAFLGLQAAIAYIASDGARECAIRLVLGATASRVMIESCDRLVTSVLLGAFAGVLVTAYTYRFVDSVVANVLPNSIGTWYLAPFSALLLALVAVTVATYRVARMQPARVLSQL